jgi:Right handed beta helix region
MWPAEQLSNPRGDLAITRLRARPVLRGRLGRAKTKPGRALLTGAALLAGAAALFAALFGSSSSPTLSFRPATAATGPCGIRVASLGSAAEAVARAPAGGVVCLTAGSYPGKLSLAADDSADVTLQAAPGAHVSTGPIAIAGSHIVVRDLWVNGEIALAAGSSFVTLEHNDISNAHNGGEGIVFDTSDCTAPNAPMWPGCEAQAPIANVTISANRIHNIGVGHSEDAIHLDNWRNVTISGNELEHIVETGNHTDCLQSVYGGTNLIFTHNYEHDNDCQGFFVKDGDATNVSFTENLFLRDQVGAYANFAQIWNVHGLTIQHNTIWDGKGLALAADNASVMPSARIDHNVFSNLVVEPPVGTPYAIAEHDNLFGQAPWSFRASPTDRLASHPRFADLAREDYRLARNPHGIGVDWSPAGQHYGPPH